MHICFCFSLTLAPCVPKHLTAQVDCQTGITTVTWDAASGATSYIVYAHSSVDNQECNSTDTNCEFSSLVCGENYSITVVARHDFCISLVSDPISVTTGDKTQLVQFINT